MDKSSSVTCRNDGTESAGHSYDWLLAHFPKNKVLKGFGPLGSGDDPVKSFKKRLANAMF
jgi:hypothetical protein